MKTSPLAWGLLTVGLGSMLGCGVTMSELQARNPSAATLLVHCRPSGMSDHVKFIAAQSKDGHIATDENQEDLLNFAPVAKVFIQVNQSAPPKNAARMAEEYGLTCPNMEQAPPSESLREGEPCSMQANAAGKSNYLGTADPQPCNPGSGGPPNGAKGSALKQAKKAQREVRVCAHPPGSDTKLDRWTSNDSEGNLIINTYEAFVKAVTNAEIVFIFDETAPPETVYWFVDDPAKLRCLNQPPPKPYAAVKASGQLDMMASAGSMAAALNQSTGSGTGNQPSGSGTSGTGTAGTTTPAAPKKGNEKTTDTSSPTGQGPPLSFFERLSRNMSLAGALAQGDTSGNTKDPNGHRNGIPGGTNVGGWSFPPLQAGVSLFQIISAVGLKPKELVDKIAAATKQGQRVIISEVDKEALKMVDQLILDAGGRAELAQGFQQVGSVMPFSMGQKVTEGLGSKFQAHKIFEKQAFKHFETILGPDKKAFDAAIAKAPSVILTDAEHQVITNRLNAFWQGVRNSKRPLKPQEVKEKLIVLYQDVYKDHPHWLQSIQHLLIQLP